jgi:hypothetical protein
MVVVFSGNTASQGRGVRTKKCSSRTTADKLLSLLKWIPQALKTSGIIVIVAAVLITRGSQSVVCLCLLACRDFLCKKPRGTFISDK